MLSAQHPIVRAAQEDPDFIPRFWAMVDRPDSPESCWKWQGRSTYGRHPMFTIKYRSVSAARIAWFAATGEFPFGGHLRRTCQNSLCVRPEHLEWRLGTRAEQLFRARSDGYVGPRTAEFGRRAG